MNTKELLAKLGETNGPLSVNEGVLWFDDGTSVDVETLDKNASATAVALTIESESFGQIVVIAPEGTGVVEADAMARKVTDSLRASGKADDLDTALNAFADAGFNMPTYATIELVS